MTTEEKRKVLEDNQYTFIEYHGKWGKVLTPDGWEMSGRLIAITDDAWQHYQQQQYILHLELMVYDAGYRTFVGDELMINLYQQICDKYTDEQFAELCTQWRETLTAKDSK